MPSSAAACKVARCVLVHRCSLSTIVGHVQDAFVSSDFMLLLQCESRWFSTAVKELMLGSLQMLRARSGDVGTTCAFVEGTNTIILSPVSTSILLLAARSAASR